MRFLKYTIFGYYMQWLKYYISLLINFFPRHKNKHIMLLHLLFVLTPFEEDWTATLCYFKLCFNGCCWIQLRSAWSFLLNILDYTLTLWRYTRFNFFNTGSIVWWCWWFDAANLYIKMYLIRKTYLLIVSLMHQ